MSATNCFVRAKAAYEAVAQMLLHTLVVARDDGNAAFVVLGVVLRRKLLPCERQGLAWAALASLDAEGAGEVMACFLGAGSPLPPFLDIQEEADDWADWATPEEHWAFGRACLTRLSPGRRRALWRIVDSEPGP